MLLIRKLTSFLICFKLKLDKFINLKIMHILQKKLLELCDTHNLAAMKLRDIAQLVDESHPQKIKHHLQQLERKGFIHIDNQNQTIEKVNQVSEGDISLFSLPIVGMASCGTPTMLAEESLEGYLKLSPSMVGKKAIKDLFVIKAVGNSMNQANIEGKSIEEGDYVIVDRSLSDPNNNDYVLSVIDGTAAIKKFVLDRDNKQIILISESSYDYPPIYIHQNDFASYMVNGKIIQVIKKP